MKKITLFLGAILLVFTLTACTKLETSPDKTDDLLINKIENWELYQEIENPEDKWVGAGECGNPEFAEFKNKVKQGSIKLWQANGVLDLFITPNYLNWSNEQFLTFNNDETAICSAGGRYPLKAYPDKLLWKGVCGTGNLPSSQECLFVDAIVIDYLGKSTN